MLNFCTLFNSYYLAKGIALYESLLATCPSFQLYIFTFDDVTFNILTEKKFAHTTIISLHEFESKELLAKKADRSVAEYCWTCTPFTIKYCLDKYEIPSCTYLDADTYFYSDPTFLIEEMGENSVLITPHNYYPAYDQSSISGIYCVQFICFKRTLEGLEVLNWWQNACLNWCYSRYEDGKMGDQKYLDSWPYMFNGVHICRSFGAGFAPWNLLNFKFDIKGDKYLVNENNLVFYHFHDLKHLSDDSWYLGGYKVQTKILDLIYKPYIKALKKISENIKEIYLEVDGLGTSDISSFNNLSLKYKIGIYILDFKKSFREFYLALFFIKRREYYKENFIKL